MELKDRVLQCVECGQDFVFTLGEQTFYAAKGFEHAPRRCKNCKSKHRGKKGETEVRYVETAAVCSQCGKATTVPFKPRSGRPVFCRDCFQQRRKSAPPMQPAAP